MANAETGVPEATAPAITREFLAAHHPDLIAALQGEGASAERARMLDVQAQSMPGHEALIAALMADGVTSGPQAAVQILAAERALASTRRSALAADRIDPVAFAAAPSAADEAAQADAEDADMPLEARCEKQWNASAKLQSEFGTLASYVAYTKATESGRARVLSRK